MGLREFFTRRFARSAGSRGTEPRCDHYSFAHVVLRDAAFQNPAGCVTSLASDNSAEFLNGLWHSVGLLCEEHGQAMTLDPNDILIHKLPVGPYPCALLEMPTPEFATEAFFIALVLSVDLMNRSPQLPAKSLWYLTLEYSTLLDCDIETVIGEWSSGGNYEVLCSGPAPELETFTSCVREIVLDRRLT
jgi:hypothetical protein